MAIRCSSLFVAAHIAMCGLAPPAKAGQPLTFEQHIRPILKAHCFQCHGDEDEKEANLDLRLVRLIAKGGDTGPAIVAGHAAKSLLVERLIANEMPPEGKSKPVSPKDLATIQAWLDQGAKTARSEPELPAPVMDDEKAFWSFQSLSNPALPDVTAADRVRSPIDAFLLAELEKHKLAFSPAADQRTLIRRAYFDLIGLPPSPDEIAVFIADASPDSFERLLDRLLASPHYGERWGRHWLDVAGYADS